jgi:6-phosphofructo-2-kinase
VLIFSSIRLQHDTKIFNVGNRRRVAAGALDSMPNHNADQSATDSSAKHAPGTGLLPPPALEATNGVSKGSAHRRSLSYNADIAGGIDQSAEFFDPNNHAAAELREKVALETLDELLEFILYKGGSVGILDATNSTRERRKAILDRIRQRAGNQIGVVFLESECHDVQLLEANMRLKLQGPDYKESDPVQALEDFKRRGMHLPICADCRTGIV